MPSEKDLTFGGEEHFDVPAAKVFALLTDLDQFAKNIPDLVNADRAGERTLNCVVKPGFSFLRGTMKLAIEMAELEAPRHAKMLIRSSGIGVQMLVESTLNIADTGAGSRLNWEARVTEMKGLVATVSPSLVRGAAEQIIRTSWSKIHEQLAS